MRPFGSPEMNLSLLWFICPLTFSGHLSVGIWTCDARETAFKLWRHMWILRIKQITFLFWWTVFHVEIHHCCTTDSSCFYPKMFLSSSLCCRGGWHMWLVCLADLRLDWFWFLDWDWFFDCFYFRRCGVLRLLSFVVGCLNLAFII